MFHILKFKLILKTALLHFYYYYTFNAGMQKDLKKCKNTQKFDSLLI